MADNTRQIDWDDQITNDGEPSEELVTLPEGNYPFEVIKAEQHYYDGSDKIPACNMAKIFLRIDGGELGKSLCVEQIYLVEKLEWKASAFLRSIGMKKHGEPTVWRDLLRCNGKTGRCKIYVDTYEKNGKSQESNKIKSFYDKDENREDQAPKKAYKKGAF